MCCSPTLSASSPGRSEKGAKRPREDRCTNAASLQQPSAAYYPVSTSSQRGRSMPSRYAAIGIDYEDVRATVEKTFGPGALESAPDRRVRSGSTRRPPFTYAWLQPSSRRKLSVVVGCLDPEKLDSGDHGAVLERLDVHGDAERRVMGPTCCEPGLRRRGPAWCRLAHGGPDLVNDLPAVQSPSDRTVKKLTDQVRMTVVPGIFLDHVDIDPSQ